MILFFGVWSQILQLWQKLLLEASTFLKHFEQLIKVDLIVGFSTRQQSLINVIESSMSPRSLSLTSLNPRYSTGACSRGFWESLILSWFVPNHLRSCCALWLRSSSFRIVFDETIKCFLSWNSCIRPSLISTILFFELASIRSAWSPQRTHLTLPVSSQISISRFNLCLFVVFVVNSSISPTLFK